MSRIVNRWRGVCLCGTIVPVGLGFVCSRKITCIECAPVPVAQPRPVRTPSSIAYQGYDDSHLGIHSESFGEHLLDIGMNESDYVGFDVGDQ